MGWGGLLSNFEHTVWLFVCVVVRSFVRLHVCSLVCLLAGLLSERCMVIGYWVTGKVQQMFRMKFE